MSAAVYLRISDDKDGREAGVQRQETECRALAARMDLAVAEVFVDNDRSASEYAKKPRDGYRELRAAVSSGRIRTVLAWSPDRLHRMNDELESWKRLTRDRDVATVFVNGGTMDTRSAAGRMYARTGGVHAAYESDIRSERVGAAMATLAHQGKWSRGPAFGWGWTEVEKKPGVVVRRFTGERDPVQARLVADACSDVLRGESLSGIAAGWNAAGHLSAKGRSWNPTTVKQVLTRAANAGLVEHRGEVLEGVTGQWEPLVTEETWRAVVRTLSDPSRKTTTARSDRWLGAGVYVCGVCGSRLRSASTTERSGGVRALYRCRQGSHVYRDARLLDEYVTGVVLGVLAKPENLLQRPEETNKGDLVVERRRLRERLDQAADDYADDRITAAQRDRITARTRERLQDVERELAPDPAARTLDGLAGVSSERWDALPVTRRRAAVRLLVDVVVLPTGRTGKGLKADGVRFDWRRS